MHEIRRALYVTAGSACSLIVMCVILNSMASITFLLMNCPFMVKCSPMINKLFYFYEKETL